MFESEKKIFRTETIRGKEISQEEYLMPENLHGYFEVKSIRKKNQEYCLELVEKKDQIPIKAKGRENLVLNGYMNRVEYLTFPNYGLPVYIQAYRRRWKDQETGEAFFNEYEFHPSGMKTCHAFAAFLKEAPRERINELFHDWESIRHIRKEGLQVVSRDT